VHHRRWHDRERRDAEVDGSAAYDRKIERELYGWKYRLFTVDGEPVPVCTAVTFVYSQD
jgi:hypothetical protein